MVMVMLRLMRVLVMMVLMMLFMRRFSDHNIEIIHVTMPFSMLLNITVYLQKHSIFYVFVKLKIVSVSDD